MRRQRAIGCGLGGRPQPLSDAWMPEPLHECPRSPPNPSPSQYLGARNDKQNYCAHHPAGAVADDEVHCARSTNTDGVRRRREAGGLGVCRRARCHARFCVAQFSSIEDRCWHDDGDDKREERQTNREIGDGEEASRRNRLVRGNVAPYTADVRWLTGQGGEDTSLTTLHGAHTTVHTLTSTQIFSSVVERASIRGSPC